MKKTQAITVASISASGVNIGDVLAIKHRGPSWRQWFNLPPSSRYYKVVYFTETVLHVQPCTFYYRAVRLCPRFLQKLFS